MGNQPSAPQPGTSLRVIGAGLSRTGTASFSEALRILLQAPVYHGGTQLTLAATHELQPTINLLSHYPPQTPSETALLRGLLAERLDGYAAVTDAPFSGLVEHLVALHPDALVICTTRDPASWVRSMEGLRGVVTGLFLRFALLPLPGIRHFPAFVDALQRQWRHLYGTTGGGVTPETYHRHMAYLQRVVPADRLVFVDVKDGWEPLCRALGVQVPRDVEFPRINDSEAIARRAEELVREGLKRWAVGFGAVGVAVVAYMASGRR